MTRPTMTGVLQFRFQHSKKKEKSSIKRDQTPIGRGITKNIDKVPQGERVFSFDDRGKRNNSIKKHSKTPLFEN